MKKLPGLHEVLLEVHDATSSALGYEARDNARAARDEVTRLHRYSDEYLKILGIEPPRRAK